MCDFKNKHLDSLENQKSLILRSVYLFHCNSPPPPSCLHFQGVAQRANYPEKFKLALIRGFITQAVGYQEEFLCWRF